MTRRGLGDFGGAAGFLSRARTLARKLRGFGFGFALMLNMSRGAAVTRGVAGAEDLRAFLGLGIGLGLDVFQTTPARLRRLLHGDGPIFV